MRREIDSAYHLKILRSVIFFLVIFYIGRCLLAFFEGRDAVAAYLASGFIFLSLAWIFLRKSTYRAVSFFMTMGLTGMEAWLAYKGFLHFSEFLLLTPVCIVFVSMMSGLWYGFVAFILATFTGLYLANLPSNINETYGITVEHSVFAKHFLCYLLAAEVLTSLAIFLFYQFLGKSESDILEMKNARAKVERRRVLADTMGSLAHELNNPIAIIDVAFRMLRIQREQNDHHSQVKFVHYIEEARERLENVIDSIESVTEKGTATSLTHTQFEELIDALATPKVSDERGLHD